MASALQSSPLPSSAHAGSVSQAIKDQICEMALVLLEEQTQGRIIHYRADLATNPELDAVSAQVVASLKEVQALSGSVVSSTPREAVRASHIKVLCGLLERAFRAGAPSLFLERRLKDIHKKLARLFFQAELHDGPEKTIQHGEQAVCYLLARHKRHLEDDLAAYDYVSDEVRARACHLLAQLHRDMQEAFLTRRSTELKRVVRVFHEVLVDFFCKRVAPMASDIAADVVTQSESFQGRAHAYKVPPEAFPRLRAALERRLMVELVGFAGDQLVSRLAAPAGASRYETVRFIADPRVFSMIVGEVCEGLYEMFFDEGLLDFPRD